MSTSETSQAGQAWRWLRSPRSSPLWVTASALLLLTFVALVHVDLFLRTVRVQTGLSLALLFNTVVFLVAIVALAVRAGQIGWLLGAAGALGAATAWIATQLFPVLSFMDPQGTPWQGNPLLHLMSLHIPHTGNVTFVAEIAYLVLWVYTTRHSGSVVAWLRWGVLAVSVILLAGFVVVLVLGGGIGSRSGT
jgi:hypothetical protein